MRNYAKRMIIISFLIFIFSILLYGDDGFHITVDLDGNAHVLPYSHFKKIYQLKDEDFFELFSTDALYNYFNSINSQYGDNKLLLEKKLDEAKNQLIVIYGYINQVRKSILDEYIVELSVNVDWAVFNISVVYPKKISPAMKEELMYLKRGDYFQALVFTRSTYAYVDVPVWNSNGTYRTEP